MTSITVELKHLVDYLSHQPRHDEQWNNWHIRRINGGANNLVYRTTSNLGDFAIKWSIRDARERTERECSVLYALDQFGLNIAPKILYCDNQTYPLSFSVQTWIEGEVLILPTNDHEWSKLIEHYVAIQSLNLGNTMQKLRYANVNALNPSQCLSIIHTQYSYLSVKSLKFLKLINIFENYLPRTWNNPKIALCRNDPNPSNIICRSGAWASVDWENSGWGDPAFEIADLMAHPQYQNISLERRVWLIELYSAMIDDLEAPMRISLYYRTMILWWIIRFQRMLDEIPRGGDPRLIARPNDWKEQTQANLAHYMELMHTLKYDEQP